MRNWINLTENQPSQSEGTAPGVWYHGTPNTFDQFDVDAGEYDSIHETPAIFLTNDPNLAETYASRERQPMSDGLPWGELSRDFIKPAATIIRSSKSPAAEYLANHAESVLNGQIDFEKVLDELSDVAPALRRIKAQLVARSTADHTTEGANIRPCTVTGKFMHVHFIEHFHGAMYDVCMRQAKEAGLAGVFFHNVIDSPSGGGEAADVIAVFDGKNIHPKFGLLRSLESFPPRL